MKVLIIGAGIAGLTVAYQLHKHHIDVCLVEARSRIGGRILTVFPSNRPSVPIDFGSVWFREEHRHIKKLLRELRLKHYPQTIKGLAIHDEGPRKTPRQFTEHLDSPKYQLVGGMQTLVNKLQNHLPADAIQLNTIVTQLSSDTDGIVATAIQNDKTLYYDADYVINTIPPILAATTIIYDPQLPQDLYQTLSSIPTWMGQTIKIVLVYDSPFWRKMGLSGTSISEYGLVNEFYDVSPPTHSFGVLVGIIKPDSLGYNMFKEDRKQGIVEQVKRLYGWQANEIKVYDEINWAYESYTTDYPINTPINDESLYGNPRLQEPSMNGRLYWGSSEISSVSGGYMDGAVYRANEIAQAILK